MISDFDKDIKDEIHQLRNELDSNSPSQRKNAVKRVLNFMRSGENVGSLFTSMLRCVHTEDIQLKKLVYLYLVTYSTQEPEQSIMAVNTFIHDSEDPNPIVRALAVRTMCRIKLDTVAEYMIVPLKKCLSDKDPYVRKTAAIAVAKLYDVIPEAVENSQLLTILQTLLNDENPMVVSNTAMSLLEINDNRTTPIFSLNENNVTPILSAMTQCSGWVQTLLLDALSKYDPLTETEATFLIDRLVPFLKHANPSVVIGSFRCIYKFMKKDKRGHKEIFELIIPPFITLISSGNPEIQFLVLRALSLFVKRYPKALRKQTRVFFCKYNDPCYVKLEKLDIIVTICSTTNVQLIIDELEEYCNDVDVAFVRKAVHCLGQIAMKVQVASRRIVDILVKLVESKAEYAVEASIEVFADLFRVFPGEFESVISKICQNIEHIKNASAKAAAIWIIGEYCDKIEKVDVLLDPFLDTFYDEPPEVQIQILTAIVKNYLQKPETSKDQLQFLLEEATKENVLPDVRNRALIYWRFLTLDNEAAKQSIFFNKSSSISLSNDEKFEKVVLNELIKNMGSVSGVLHVLPSDFVKKQLYLPEDEANNVDENATIDHHWRKAYLANDDGIIDVFVDWKQNELWLKTVNKSQNSLSSFALAFNRNCVGIEMSNQPMFPDHLDFGESFEISVQLSYHERSILISDNPDLVTCLQVALRTSVGTKMFAIPIDFTCLTQQFGELGPQQFSTMWDQISTENTISVTDFSIAEASVLSGRGISRIVNLIGDLNEVCVAFCLPPSFVYLARMRQNGNIVQITIRGDPSLFTIIRNNASKLFCNEMNYIQ
ncbi:Adaptin N terminal region family protein [Tritrichomonas foetus]|uniref:Adaptin N terminal region family protein n=1 Tax=Tritrichomonas foetus TaxID=1144522 RepID=A0A1J4J3T6_9EUKA|nr:Adaptin N terminal region family protein [Tritrichomonas foetus]|eukprot:OHS94026.1 Adaptin N terminal region family protein [Tritrichomonas foetus]